MECVFVKGVRIYNFSTKNELIEFVEKEKKSLIAINAEKILHATDETSSLINKNIGYADGIGAVWALKRKGFKGAVKIAGAELWLDIVNHFYKSKSFYLVGAKDEVINKTIRQLKEEFPGINILGYRNGYLQTDEERVQLIDNIAELKPDVVFVAMGSPKQELLMQDMQTQHSAIYQGLGGSFDVYTGNVQRAPRWWIDNNLEWAYRLIKQPTRIKRQVHLVRYFFLVMFNQI